MDPDPVPEGATESLSSSHRVVIRRLRERRVDAKLRRVLEPEDREEAEALESVLRRIPDRFRALIRMVVVERPTTAEIATRLGKNPGAVCEMLAPALRACRAELRRNGWIRSETAGRA